jgi:hypothetical protein
MLNVATHLLEDIEADATSALRPDKADVRKSFDIGSMIINTWEVRGAGVGC